MRKIIVNNGHVITVDDRDFHYLSQFTWTAVRYKHTFYAIRNIHEGHKCLRHIFMHRDIFRLETGDGIKIDHRDGNGLNNQRGNLRKASGTQNNANRRKGIGTGSRFKGVYLDKRRGTWQASLKINGKKHYLGAFDDEQLAALAYNEAAEQSFGNFARLNEIPQSA